MLASITNPTSYFDVEEYLKEAIKELKLETKSGEDGILSYASYFVQQIADRQNVKRNLKELCQFCMDKDYEKSLYDFYLLWWAWDDFDYGNSRTDYWENVNPENIETAVVEVAKSWVTKNEKYYTQHLL